MSASVIVARTRMWRTMVAIMRGGNLCGAAWQRLQLERNLFSPSARVLSAASLLRSAEALLFVITAGSAVEFAFLGGSAANTTAVNAKIPANNVIFDFIALLSAQEAGR